METAYKWTGESFPPSAVKNHSRSSFLGRPEHSKCVCVCVCVKERKKERKKEKLNSITTTQDSKLQMQPSELKRFLCLHKFAWAV